MVSEGGHIEGAELIGSDGDLQSNKSAPEVCCGVRVMA